MKAGNGFLTPEQVAEYLQITARWVKRNAQALGGVKIGRVWRFDPERLKAATLKIAGRRP